MASIQVDGFELQGSPRIIVAAIPGEWLLRHSTPSWRIQDPVKGFQRVVREARAQAIAWTVLDQQRTFPNAVVLATDATNFSISSCKVHISGTTRFLVVDGQHRIWAQHYSDFEADYSCLIHVGLTEKQMAELFLEINDNQKRVPSSLRWDLVRLVRPDDDPYAIAAAELVYDLTTNEDSPLFQRIDLTGEQGEKELKQGSIAPELKSLVSNKRAGIRGADIEQVYDALIKYLEALRSVDKKGWSDGRTPFMKARVMRALLKLLPDVLSKAGKDITTARVSDYRKVVEKIDQISLSDEQIRAHQGSAGIKQIYEMILSQIA
ncbi:MAG: DGQHR domain-containing protein [Rhodanobacteraceae bacterium]